MAKKEKKPKKAGPKADSAAKNTTVRKSGAETPPESAENFEHVLRRLMIERDKEPHGG